MQILLTIKYDCSFLRICLQRTGSYQNVYEIDKSIVLGSEITRELGVAQLLNQNTASKTKAKVTFISSTQISNEINFEYIKIPDAPFTSADQIFSSRPHSSLQNYFYACRSGEMYSLQQN